MFIVTVENMGSTFFLRGTVWAFAADRAQLFSDREEATFALQKARKFMKAAIFKKARIVETLAADNPAQIDNV